MEKQPFFPIRYRSVLLGVSVFAVLYLTSLYNYLLFHSLAEIFSIVVACGIFMVAWNSRRFLDNNYLLFLGIAYLFIAGLDLLHTFTYKGMNMFLGYDANLPTQLWIASRYVESLSLLIAPFFLNRKLKTNIVFFSYTLVISFLLGSIFYWNIFPDCFIEGLGLTPFKKISEYIISLILFASLALLLKRGGDFDLSVLRLLVSSIILTVFSELAFTFYIHVYGLSNLFGHYFKIISFYLIYKAIIETGFTEPFALLFRNLKKSEEETRKFKTISDKAGYGVLIIDLEGTILYANDSFARMHGYKLSEIIGKNHSLFHDEEEGKKVRGLREKLLDEGGTLSLEGLHKRKDGSFFPILEHVSIVRDGRGLPLYFSTVITDITERKLAEEALRESEAKLNAMLQSIGDHVSMIDKDFNIIWANEAKKEVFGSDIIGRKCYEVYHKAKEPCESSNCIVQRAFLDGKIHEQEKKLTAKDGRTMYLYRTANVALRDEQEKPLAVIEVSRDITERKRAENELREKSEQLKTLFDAGKKVTSIVSMDELLPWIAEQAAKLLDADICYYRIREKDYLIRGGGSKEGVEIMVRHRIKMGEGISGFIAKEKKPIIIPDGYSEDPRHNLEHRKLAAKHGFRSCIGIPMCIEERLIGVLVLLSRKPEKFYKK